MTTNGKPRDDLVQHDYPLGTTYVDVLRSLGVESFVTVPGRTQSSWAKNTGNLYYAVVLFQQNGLWHMGIVWEAEVGERWILICPEHDLVASDFGEAVLKFRLQGNKKSLEVARQLVQQHPGNIYHKQHLDNALEEQRELAVEVSRLN